MSPNARPRRNEVLAILLSVSTLLSVGCVNLDKQTTSTRAPIRCIAGKKMDSELQRTKQSG